MKKVKDDWQEVRLGDISYINSDILKKSDDYDYINYLDTGNITKGIIDNIQKIDISNVPSRAKRKVDIGDIIYSTVRPIQRHYGIIKKYIDNIIVSTGFITIKVKKDVADNYFIYYNITQDDIINYLQMIAEQSVSTYPSIKPSDLSDIKIKLPPLEEQKKIASILSSLDDKIELNNRTNKILEETAQTIFKEWFINFNFPNAKGKPYKNSGGKMIKWEIDTLSNIFDITIGKTPPRKEVECFSNSNKDMKWVSISDMGKSGLYLLDTSEYLTLEAVNKYNVVIVPKDTIILSFKLTIGRVSITYEDMTTNEAIAHIKTNDKKLNEYTYFYLKNFKYSTLGSTSSIAQAVNSKLIKSIKFILPSKNILNDFHLKTRDIFNKVKYNQIENQKLASIRDSILPKLMSGEIRIK